jgi:hypothetical protein
MTRRTVHSILTLCVFTLISTTIARAQSSETKIELPLNSGKDSWTTAQSIGPSNGKIIVVTLDQPNRRQTCHIQSYTPDKLVCSRAFGGSHTYLSQQVLALILPGDDDLRLRLFIEFNGGLGAAIWGTVVLAATCPVCAVGTGIAAFLFFDAAGVILIADGQPDRLLYLAPGQKLSRKLGYVQS